MKQSSWALMLLLTSAIAGCSGEAAIPTETPVIETTTPLSATPTIAATSTTEATFTPIADTQPTFDLPFMFALKPRRGQAATRFPAGVRQVFVMWGYRNMPHESLARLEWYLDDKLWLEQEETWRHEDAGFFRAYSISDDDKGLPSGRYRLDVYIDGVAQFDASDEAGRSFDIGGLPALGADGLPVAGQGALLSPGGKRAVAFEPISHIMIKEASAEWRTLVDAGFIEYMAWMPDSQHLVYVDNFALWMADVSTGQTWQLSAAGIDVDGPLVPSPDGNIIAGLGRGLAPGGDGCWPGPPLVFMQIDSAFQWAEVIAVNDLAGFPFEPDFQEFYPVIYPDLPGATALGVWDNPTQFRAYMAIPCGSAAEGEYAYDLAARTMTRLGDSPGFPYSAEIP